jgi:uncharacterized protein YacL
MFYLNLKIKDMSTDKVTEEVLDTRFVIDKQIQDLFGSAFEDYQMGGIRYVASEVKRISESIEKENSTGKII